MATRSPQMLILRSDYDDYRTRRHCRELSLKEDGKLIYDLEEGHYSIGWVAKLLGNYLGYPVPVSNLYYMVQKGALKATKVRSFWVIDRECVIQLFERLKAMPNRAAMM